MKKILSTGVAILLMVGICSAGDTAPVLDTEDSINYSLGYQIGNDLKQQGLQVTPEAVLQGLEDAFTGSNPQLSPEEMTRTLEELKKNIVDRQRQIPRQTGLQPKKQGREFLAQNAKQQGVVALPSGLQYQVIKKGPGRVPGPHDMVKVQYRATLIDGHEFDSSYRRGKPTEWHVDGIIAGLAEALQLMHEGAHWQLFIPSNLAYGRRGPLEDRTVIFDLELLSVVPGD